MPAGRGHRVATELRQFLTSKGIPTDADQETKTKMALDFFAAELLAERAARSPQVTRRRTKKQAVTAP